jgi:hypothetical protein
MIPNLSAHSFPVGELPLPSGTSSPSLQLELEPALPVLEVAVEPENSPQRS